jgi:maltooligosyltrehalose synthase
LTHAIGAWPSGEVWSETFLVIGDDEPEEWQDLVLQKTISLKRNRLALSTILSELPFAVLCWSGKS